MADKIKTEFPNGGFAGWGLGRGQVIEYIFSDSYRADHVGRAKNNDDIPRWFLLFYTGALAAVTNLT